MGHSTEFSRNQDTINSPLTHQMHRSNCSLCVDGREWRRDRCLYHTNAQKRIQKQKQIKQHTPTLLVVALSTLSPRRVLMILCYCVQSKNSCDRPVREESDLCAKFLTKIWADAEDSYEESGASLRWKENGVCMCRWFYEERDEHHSMISYMTIITYLLSVLSDTNNFIW